MDLLNNRVVASNIWEDGAIFPYPALAPDPDRDIVPTHHEKDVVDVVHGVACVAPPVRVNRDRLHPLFNRITERG